MTQSGKKLEQGPPGKPPGIKDVARLASVSAATVSQVLNDVPGSRISVETRQRIHRAAAELGYVPNRLARGMRTGRSGMLGLISDTIATTPFAGSIVVGAQDTALKHGCTLVLVSTDGDPAVEQQSANALLKHQVDGFLYATMFHRRVDLPLALERVPTVLLDAASDRADLPSVVPDEVGGAEAAVEELLAHGHRRIGFLTNEDDVPATQGRLEGYRNSLARGGIDFDPGLVLADESVTAGGYRTARQMLDRADRPTALFCYNDRMAMGAYRAAAELGLRIPEDLSVVGFDNQLLLAEGLYPALTTVALPHYEMGAWAVDALIALLDGRPVVADGVSFPVALPCPLVRRSSVAAPS
jgi:LacI family transcriptional regulator